MNILYSANTMPNNKRGSADIMTANKWDSAMMLSYIQLLIQYVSVM